MLGRTTPLSAPALLLGLLAVLGSTRPAQAHRLEAEFAVLPGHRVQIESWFDSGGCPRSARVQVFRTNGALLTEGPMNEQGIYVFSFQEIEPFRVVVNAGLGHRKELDIPAAALAQVSSAPQTSPASAGDSSEEPSALLPRVDRSSRVSIKDVLIGVGFLLALAAFVLSLRNARQLRAISRARDAMDEKERK
jgi:hypothetical protein